MYILWWFESISLCQLKKINGGNENEKKKYGRNEKCKNFNRM